MSNWLWKSSKKKSSNVHHSKTDISVDHPSTSFPPKPSATIRSSSTATTSEDTSSNVTDDDEKIYRPEKWSFWKHRKRTTTGNNSPLSSSKFFCFGSTSTKHESPLSPLVDLSTENVIKWEEILDKEFQSLDIDADGYVSVADLQSVLK